MIYQHQFSPILVELFNGISIQWYGLSLLVCFLISIFLFAGLGARQKMGLTPSMAGEFTIYCLLGAMIGARLGYCLFYSPDLFLKFKSESPYWAVFALGEGGMSIHGAALGLFFTATFYAIKTGISRFYLYDLISFVAPLVIAIGRLASFATGEMVGRVAPENFPLLIQYPNLEGLRYPSQLIEAGAEGMLLFLILAIFWRTPKVSGMVAGLFLVLYSVFSFGAGFLREPDPTVGLGLLELARGQWLSVWMFIAGIVVLFLWSGQQGLRAPGWSLGHSVKLHRR